MAEKVIDSILQAEKEANIKIEKAKQAARDLILSQQEKAKEEEQKIKSETDQAIEQIEKEYEKKTSALKEDYEKKSASDIKRALDGLDKRKEEMIEKVVRSLADNS